MTRRSPSRHLPWKIAAGYCRTYFKTMDNHFPPISVPIGEKSIAYCSYLKPKNLVVFVHGFNGSSTDTWNEFPTLIQKEAKFKETDFIFYGYDSLKTQASNMKLRLYQLINTAIDPLKMPYALNRNLGSNFSYDKIILVAHSLGAVVARMSLLHAHRQNALWLDKVHMLLFAPAHFGSRIPENFKDCFTGITVLLRSFAVTKYPIIKDLTEGSTILTRLEEDTKRLLQTGKGDFIKAKGVVWASNDTVVINNTFCDDCPEAEIVNTTHTSVCKPSAKNSHEPFKFLLKLI